jgi:hypothetical protein
VADSDFTDTDHAQSIAEPNWGRRFQVLRTRWLTEDEL